MSPEPGKHRSRVLLRSKVDPASDPPATHSHKLPPTLVRAVVGLIAIAVLQSIAIGCLALYAFQDHQYVLGRGQYRDQEQQRTDAEYTEKLRQAVCSLLDHLPAGAAFDPPRAEYNCEGKGVPFSSLTPEQRQNLSDIIGGSSPVIPSPAVPSPSTRPTPSPTFGAPLPLPTKAAPSAAAPSGAPPATTSQPPAAPSTAPSSSKSPLPTSSAPSTTSGPLIDLGLTDAICDRLGICL